MKELDCSHAKELTMKIPADVPDCAIFLLGKAYQKAHADFKKRLKPYRLTNLQHLVLEALWYEEGVTAADLGKRLILDKATLSGVLERMAEARWIIKKEDDHDRRVYRLYPSPKADKLRSQLMEVRIKANKGLLSVFNREEQVLFKRMLLDLI